MKKNKDPNFVAKIEQAIQKKYGKETVQHPKANWDEDKEKDYLSQIEGLKQEVVVSNYVGFSLFGILFFDIKSISE